MVTPGRILRLMLYAAVMALIIVMMAPEDGGIELGGGVSVKLPKLQMLLTARADTAKLSKRIEALRKRIENRPDEKLDLSKLSFKTGEGANPNRTSGASAIEFAPGNAGALDHFFRSLQGLESSGELIRILHYGDSQLEGDRVTSYLRMKFQTQFGGCGIGSVAISEVDQHRLTCSFEVGEGWEKQSILGENQAPHKNYGHLGNLHHANGTTMEGNAPDEIFDNPNWVVYRRSVFGSNPKANTFEQATVLYRSATTPLHALITLPDTDPVRQVFSAQDAFSHQTIPLSSGEDGFQHIKFHFGAKRPFDVYAISFDCQAGIAVDNIPMRGSSGTDFSKISRRYLDDQLNYLNTKLIILQFGVNTVPYMTEKFRNYENSLYSQIKYLQSLKPDDMDILVIGVSDMSQKEGVDMVSYDNIPSIRNAQRNAAFRAGCAFWDLYQAMGGQNSMALWVESGLARPDHTHFTTKGAKIVGQDLYEELMKEYQRYLDQAP